MPAKWWPTAGAGKMVETFEELLERYNDAGWKLITGKWVMFDDHVNLMFGAPPDIRHLCRNIGFMHRASFICGECGEKAPGILQAHYQLDGYNTR